MKIEFHIGLHKTGSTYLQAVANQNADVLKRHGVYYERQTKYPAHNQAAWKIIEGDMSPLTKMIQGARRANCETLLFSSEDLSLIIFDVNIKTRVERVARNVGADVRYHVCIRRQDEAFWSNYYEFSWNHFCDPYYFFYEVMRNGCYSANMTQCRPSTDAGNPFAIHCFDYNYYLGDFGRRTDGALRVYDFAESAPFPGWRLFPTLGVPCGELGAPDSGARNARPADDVVEAQFQKRVREAPPRSDPGLDGLLDRIRPRWRVDEEARATMSRMLMGRFAAGNAELLRRYGGDGDSDLPQ